MSKRKFELPNLSDKLIELETFIGKYGITIAIDSDEDTHYDFKLITEGNKIALLSASITESNVRTFITRSHRELEENRVINILWIEIDEDHPEYIGKGLGSFLLLYSLIYLKKEYPEIKWSILDDDSDRSKSTKNIYSKMGFKFVDLVSLTKEKTLKISGPEKQLDIESDFLPVIDHLIISVKTKIDRAFSKKNGGNKKTRKNSNKRMKSVKKKGINRKNTKKNKLKALLVDIALF